MEIDEELVKEIEEALKLYPSELILDECQEPVTTWSELMEWFLRSGASPEDLRRTLRLLKRVVDGCKPPCKKCYGKGWVDFTTGHYCGGCGYVGSHGRPSRSCEVCEGCDCEDCVAGLRTWRQIDPDCPTCTGEGRWRKNSGHRPTPCKECFPDGVSYAP